MPTACSSLLYSPDPPGQRPPQTETPWTETCSPDRDPLDRYPPPRKEHKTRYRDSQKEQSARQEVTSYRTPPTPVNKMTNASKNMTLPQTPFSGGSNNILASLEYAKNSLMC